MARSEARRMLMRSISSTLACAIDQAIARSLMRSASTSRRCGSSTLESARPRTCRAGSRITAAAYTGPAIGPRPASSTPQIRVLLIDDLQDRLGGLLRGVLTQQLMKLAEALHLAALSRGVAQERE